MRRCCFSSSLNLFLVVSSFMATAWAKHVPFLDAGFMFDYNNATQPVPIPVTEQCERIHIKWGRQTATGPNPVAPYSLLVYTSTFLTPFSIAAGGDVSLSYDWDVPFAPGTQYQICMWDKNGVSGGCQAMYTVVQNSTVPNPTCQNITFPPLLNVEATVAGGGPMSQYGFIDQCTDLFVTPKAGKPPFTLTVAPALHPPYNITSNSMDPIGWTVSLSWSYPFFLSLVSSDGQGWVNGPLHAGGLGPSDCLAPGTISHSKAQVIAAGAGIGGAVATGLLGALAAFLYARCRRIPPGSQIDAFDTTLYDIADKPQRTGSRTYSQSQSEALSRTTMADRRSSQRVSGRAYVLHHDAGQAPVTVITDATEVVELPPRYRRESGSNSPLPAVPENSQPVPVAPQRVLRTTNEHVRDADAELSGDCPKEI
ncbi:hypothetical protein C8R47DRAFT_1159141 [Mycena vitilis]|nr:hypothetical protein C8R47DRAFT_1159141 [Mycena vitilis]